MNGVDPLVPVVNAQALVDAQGRLVSADPAIAALHRQAGGGDGALLGVPAIAVVAGLARRLGIPVSRSVVVADEDVDRTLRVHARPEGDHVRLAIGGWQECRPVRLPADDAAEVELALAGADWWWETDAALRLTFVSIDAGSRHGFDAPALLGQPLTRLFAIGEDDEELPILDALAHRRAFSDRPARLCGDGAAMRLSACVRRDVYGDFAGFVGAVHAVPQDAGGTASLLSDDFTAGLDRALRRPLGRIIGHADGIRAQEDGRIGVAYTDYATDIASAGRHLLGLIDDLVDLQAIERADFAPPADPIDLADVARRAVALLRVRASDLGISLVAPDGDVTVAAYGDFRRALQIMVNLVGNAIRYAPKISTVTVTVARVGRFAEAMVADGGKGIAPADQARIFDKFVRIDAGEPGNSGLGLYISRRLARVMGGDVTVASAPGEGARFTVSLPADPPRDEDQ